MSMFPDDWLPSQLTFEPERLVIVHVNNNNISQAVVVVVFSRSSKPHISSKPKSHHLVFSLVVYHTFFGGGEVREGRREEVTGLAFGLKIPQPDDRLRTWPRHKRVLSLGWLLDRNMIYHMCPYPKENST